MAAIREIREKKLVERSAKMGDVLGKKLNALRDKHPSIGDVRGRGLFWAVELVRDRETREPFNTAEDKLAGRPLVVDKICKDMFGRGVFAMGWIGHIIIAPPLIITEGEMDRGVKALDESLTLADAELSA